MIEDNRVTRDALDRIVRAPAPAAPVAPMQAPDPRRIPLRARLRMYVRAAMIRLAVRLVGRRDAVVVSRMVYVAALDHLAWLAEWGNGSHIFKGRPDAARSLDAAVEDVTRLVVLAAELGDPGLQLAGLQERFALARLHAMSPGKRRRLEHEAALAALAARIGRRPARDEARAAAAAMAGA